MEGLEEDERERELSLLLQRGVGADKAKNVDAPYPRKQTLSMQQLLLQVS
jgi:hypothetical protein